MEEAAAGLGLKVLARLPMDPSLAAACDQGQIDAYVPNPLAPLAQTLEGMA